MARSDAASFDIAIVGAGCAGRSLAWHLLDHGIEGRRVVLIDPRAVFEPDRTWCLFDVVPHAFEPLVSHAWSRWRVRAEHGPWVERSAPGLRYTMLPSQRFYEATTRRLETAGVRLRLGVSATKIETRRQHAVVQTDKGPITARAVFDSRPVAHARRPGTVSLTQHFTGWFVRTEAAVFEPGVATLMDFAVPQDRGISFLYELPFDEHSALIEATWFDSEGRDGPGRSAMHDALLRRRTAGVNHVIERTETGVILMTSTRVPARSSERVYPIGLAGGMAKPSTGYAFAAIQRYSAEMAARLASADLPEPPAPRPWKARAQDAAFLSYLERHPRSAPRAFVRFFEQLPPHVLARFLSDQASPREDIEVMRLMPPGVMAREVLRSRRAWLRR